MCKVNKEHALNLWRKGPYVSKYGLVIVPLHPTSGNTYKAKIELLKRGFFYSKEYHCMVRLINEPRNGKVYGAEAWLKSAMNFFRKVYPDWEEPDNTNRLASQVNNPYKTAYALYLLFGGKEALRTAIFYGYEHWWLAGAIKNNMNITDKAIRRSLQQITAKEYAKYASVYPTLKSKGE